MKKRKHSKKHRRVGAIKSSGLLKIGSIAAGYFMADTINEQIDKIVPKKTDTTTTPPTTKPNDTIAMIGEIGLGGLLLMKKLPVKLGIAGELAGGVLVGAGLKRVLKKAGIVSGYQAVPVIGAHRKRMAGYQSTPVLGSIPPQLSGTPAQLQGYVPQGSGVSGYIPAGSGVMGAVGSCGVASGSGITNSGGGSLMS